MVSLPYVSRPSADKVERAAVALARALGDSRVLLGDACAPYAKDDCPSAGVMPDVVVCAESASDVQKALEIAARFDLPITPRAAGTGRTGGAIPLGGGLVLATHTLARIKDIDRKNRIAVVEPGVITGEFAKACEAMGLFYPPDPNSLAECMLGGNVGENAGGPRALKYGVTREYVLGLRATLASGQELSLGRATSKGVTGYDLTSLFVGSEGTLGVTTEITLKLLPKPNQVHTLLALFSSVQASTEAVTRVFDAALLPRCIELMDGPTLDVLRRSGLAVDAQAQTLLILEVDDVGADAALETLGNVLAGSAGCIRVETAKDEASRDKMWAARRSLSYATRKAARHKISEDVVVPRTRMTELLTHVELTAANHKLQHLTYGHAGDGNLHVNFLWNDPSQEPQVALAVESLMRETIRLGGTLSGEHGIGITKAPYLALEQADSLIAVQKQIKAVFDPKGLMNPGKIFPTGHALPHRAC